MFEIIQRQHSEIIKLTKYLIRHNSIQNVTENAFDISLLIGTLLGKLTMHLSSEDKFIYPYLMNKQDQKIQETSRQFAAEMGGLAQAFSDYKNKYLADSKIKNAPGEFIQEMEKVMQAIVERIEKEEKYLYPLL